MNKLKSKNTKEVDSILVIRSAPLPRFFEVLKRLRKDYPNAKISILVQKEVKDEIERVFLATTPSQGSPVERVIVGIKRGRVGIISHLPLLFRLRREVFDLVVIIYNSDEIDSYGNLRLFAWALRAKRRIGITIMDTSEPFSIKETILKDLILPILALVVITIPLFLILTIPILLIPVILTLLFKRVFERLKELS